MYTRAHTHIYWLQGECIKRAHHLAILEKKKHPWDCPLKVCNILVIRYVILHFEDYIKILITGLLHLWTISTRASIENTIGSKLQQGITVRTHSITYQLVPTGMYLTELHIKVLKVVNESSFSETFYGKMATSHRRIWFLWGDVDLSTPCPLNLHRLVCLWIWPSANTLFAHVSSQAQATSSLNSDPNFS